MIGKIFFIFDIHFNIRILPLVHLVRKISQNIVVSKSCTFNLFTVLDDALYVRNSLIIIVVKNFSSINRF